MKIREAIIPPTTLLRLHPTAVSVVENSTFFYFSFFLPFGLVSFRPRGVTANRELSSRLLWLWWCGWGGGGVGGGGGRGGGSGEVEVELGAGAGVGWSVGR